MSKFWNNRPIKKNQKDFNSYDMSKLRNIQIEDDTYKNDFILKVCYLEDNHIDPKIGDPRDPRDPRDPGNTKIGDKDMKSSLYSRIENNILDETLTKVSTFLYTYNYLTPDVNDLKDMISMHNRNRILIMYNNSEIIGTIFAIYTSFIKDGVKDCIKDYEYIISYLCLHSSYRNKNLSNFLIDSITKELAIHGDKTIAFFGNNNVIKELDILDIRESNIFIVKDIKNVKRGKCLIYSNNSCNLQHIYNTYMHSKIKKYILCNYYHFDNFIKNKNNTIFYFKNKSDTSFIFTNLQKYKNDSHNSMEAKYLFKISFLQLCLHTNNNNIFYIFDIMKYYINKLKQTILFSFSINKYTDYNIVKIIKQLKEHTNIINYNLSYNQYVYNSIEYHNQPIDITFE